VRRTTWPPSFGSGNASADALDAGGKRLLAELREQRPLLDGLLLECR
jgi:hypothetical protein